MNKLNSCSRIMQNAVGNMKHTQFILTSAVLSLACRFFLPDKVESTWTVAFKLLTVFICCELFVTPLSFNNTFAALFCSESSPLSTIYNNNNHNNARPSGWWDMIWLVEARLTFAICSTSSTSLFTHSETSASHIPVVVLKQSVHE